MKEIEIFREPVELYKILKFEGLAGSGGEAKSHIAAGHVLVNDRWKPGNVERLLPVISSCLAPKRLSFSLKPILQSHRGRPCLLAHCNESRK
jgi:hypothetical protein